MVNVTRTRRVTATMHRGSSKEVIMVRHFNYFDTAMPRMVQLCISYANETDIVVFTSVEFGFQLGVLRVLKGGRFEMEMNSIVKASPSLLKLL